MTDIDSQVVFRQRALQLGLKDDLLDKMAKRGWNTMGTYAFASPYMQGQGEDKFASLVVQKLLEDPDHADGPKLRRLFFEAYTLTAGDIRARMERASDDAPKKMNNIERSARLQKLATRLPGLRLKGIMEPAHCLIDLAAQFVEENALRHVNLHECISREEELQGAKKSKEWKTDGQGYVREVHSKSTESHADVSTDLKIFQALHRRGVAFQVANLMTYEEHDALSQVLMDELQRQPISSQHAAVGHEQLQRADREVWKLVSASTLGNLSPDATGAYPAGVALKAALDNPTFRSLLMQLPAPAKRPLETKTEPGSGSATQSKRRKAAPKATASGFKMPSGLQGTPTTPQGARICFSYNLGNCKESGKGCPRGRHVCTRCYGDHAFIKCGGRKE